ALPVMVTANQVANARTSLAARLKTAAGFRIDPVPHRLNPALGWSHGIRGVKRSYGVLDREYGQGLGFTLLAPAIRWALLDKQLRQGYVANVLKFQYGYLLR